MNMGVLFELWDGEEIKLSFSEASQLKKDFDRILKEHPNATFTIKEHKFNSNLRSLYTLSPAYLQREKNGFYEVYFKENDQGKLRRFLVKSIRQEEVLASYIIN